MKEVTILTTDDVFRLQEVNAPLLNACKHSLKLFKQLAIINSIPGDLAVLDVLKRAIAAAEAK
jgi:hypothetical protein